MRKKACKILILTLLLSMAAFSVTLASFSAKVEPKAIDDLSGNVYNILGAAQWIGFIVGIAMCIWIGIKYLTAGAGQKAEVKSTMIPWLIGAACVALAPTLGSAVFKMFAGNPGGGAQTSQVSQGNGQRNDEIFIQSIENAPTYKE